MSLDSEVVEKIVKLIIGFLNGRRVKLSENEKKTPSIFHYFQEIIRFWSKLNYVLQKTLRSLSVKKVSKETEAMLLFAAYRILIENAEPEQVRNEVPTVEKSYLARLRTFSWGKALKNKRKVEKLSISRAYPRFLIKNLLQVMYIDFLEKNLEYMNNYQSQDTFTVHVTKEIESVLNLCMIDLLQNNLLQDKSLFTKDEHIPHLYHVPIEKKGEIIQSELFSSGDLIILDKASASVIDILSPTENTYILDMCAAPGTKTALISRSTNFQSHIIAIEFSSKRTIKLKNFSQFHANPFLNLMNADSIDLPLKEDLEFDFILLDAPCTGSGALLSSPELKWRQNESFLRQNMTLQEKLLETAINRLKPSGVFVYSTCSLYPQEGELQIIKYLDNLNPLPIPDWITPSYKINGQNIDGTGRLFPATHHTEGFFIGKFQKNT